MWKLEDFFLSEMTLIFFWLCGVENELQFFFYWKIFINSIIPSSIFYFFTFIDTNFTSQDVDFW